MNGPWLRWLYNVSTKKIPKLEFFRFFATPKNCEACKRHRPTTPLTELPNTDYGLLLRRRGPLQPIRMSRNDVS